MAERLAALVVLLAGGAYIVLAQPYPRGVAAKPGPGFFPVIVGVILCVAGIGYVIETFRHRPASRAPLEPAGRVRVLATSGVLVFFCLALPWAGYVACAFVFVAGMLRALGGSWRLTLVTAAVCAAASHYVFAQLLGVPLPTGAWLD